MVNSWELRQSTTLAKHEESIVYHPTTHQHSAPKRQMWPRENKHLLSFTGFIGTSNVEYGQRLTASLTKSSHGSFPPSECRPFCFHPHLDSVPVWEHCRVWIESDEGIKGQRPIRQSHPYAPTARKQPSCSRRMFDEYPRIHATDPDAFPQSIGRSRERRADRNCHHSKRLSTTNNGSDGAVANDTTTPIGQL